MRTRFFQIPELIYAVYSGWHIQRFYQQEYELGKESLSIIKKNHGVELSNDEAGFIALHIVNGQLDEDVHDMYEITKIMQEIENIVRYRFKIEFNEESAYYPFEIFCTTFS